jgi:hypothetical protein
MAQGDTNSNNATGESSRSLGVERILRDNSAVPFVKRILLPFKAPVAIDPTDPQKKRVMTHKMAWGEADGNYYAYPTVMPDENGNLKDYGKQAFDEAIKRRDFLKFNKPEEADNFTKTYKDYWKQIGYEPKVGE